jgi:hypothetical protein
MPRTDRLEGIKSLQAERGNSIVITYSTSTRPNFESHMAMDVIPIIIGTCRRYPHPPRKLGLTFSFHPTVVTG